MAKAILPNPQFESGQVLTTAVLNQIAENSDPRREVSRVSVLSSGSNLTTTTSLTAISDTLVSHVTRTGRVRIIFNATLAENQSAAAAYSFTFYYGATPVTNILSAGNTHSQLSVVAGSTNNFYMVYDLTGLDVNTQYQFQVWAVRNSGTGRLRLQRAYIMIEDV
jgi:hypothetical protein